MREQIEELTREKMASLEENSQLKRSNRKFLMESIELSKRVESAETRYFWWSRF